MTDSYWSILWMTIGHTFWIFYLPIQPRLISGKAESILNEEGPAPHCASTDPSNLVCAWSPPDVDEPYHTITTSSKPQPLPVAEYGRITAAYLRIGRYCGIVNQRQDKANWGMSSQMPPNPAGSVQHLGLSQTPDSVRSLAATRASPSSIYTDKQ